MVLGVGEFHENRHTEVRTFLADMNEITYPTRVSYMQL